MVEFDEMLSSTNVIVAVKDMQLRYIYCNDTAVQSLGFDSPKQIRGKTDYDLFPAIIAKKNQAGDHHTIKHGVLIHEKERLPLFSKQDVDIITNKKQYRNKKNELLGIVIVASIISPAPQKLDDTNALHYDSLNKVYRFSRGNTAEFFTVREYEVFKLLLLGLTAKSIANKLYLSFRTVEEYIQKVKSKLNCHRKYQITEKAIALGIMPQDLIS